MPISKFERIEEEKKLEDTLSIIRKKISTLGSELFEAEEKALEFKKFLWDSHTEIDPTEMRTMMSDNDVEVSIMMNRGEYLQKLFRIQNKPYFGSIIWKSDDINTKETIYIGITHVEENLNNYVHDWRSPICSMFYDYETGIASYEAPEGTINGMIERKRQYTIESGKLIHIFDNKLNIDDKLLQEVLATESSDKMKNIVNTIQKEQNEVIRNIKDKNLIVEGIAGSGKKSVALHRIAFLLYKITDLTSNDILIFSPNQVFSEYISNVLPELGEKNTLQTTYHDYLKNYLKEFKEVETFTNFIENYYQNKSTNYSLIKYKQSDNITNDIDNYIKDLVSNSHFKEDLITKDLVITKEELNNLLKNRYNHFPIFKRIDVIAEKLCDRYYNGKLTKKKTLIKLLYEKLNIKKDYITIYNNFFESKFSKIKTKISLNKKKINYEDATIFIYIKFLLDEIDYNTNIRQIVIDEAQDYTKTQYLILTKIFKNVSYTILGDVNQTINPYYKYNSLNILTKILPSSKYLQLLKTYRSSPEIIEYTNKILNLSHVSAIRRDNKLPVIERNHLKNIKPILSDDLKNLNRQYQSVAIITKTEEETEKLYNQLKDNFNIIKIDFETEKFNRKLVILPSYIAKGLEFDAVIVYTDETNPYIEEEKYLFYVACTRCQHQLIVYNNKEIIHGYDCSNLLLKYNK